MTQRHAKRVDPANTLKNEIETCYCCSSMVVHQIMHRLPPLSNPSQVLLATSGLRYPLVSAGAVGYHVYERGGEGMHGVSSYRVS
jgi:hypothetical protein